MSRHGYSEDYDERFPNALELYRHNVESAISGRRGQAFLRALRDALDAMPVKELGRGGLVDDMDGRACALGVVALRRGVDAETLMNVDESDHNAYAARLLGIAECMAAEIAFENDEGAGYGESPAARWQRMRSLVAENLRPEAQPAGGSQ